MRGGLVVHHLLHATVPDRPRRVPGLDVGHSRCRDGHASWRSGQEIGDPGPIGRDQLMAGRVRRWSGACRLDLVQHVDQALDAPHPMRPHRSGRVWTRTSRHSPSRSAHPGGPAASPPAPPSSPAARPPEVAASCSTVCTLIPTRATTSRTQDELADEHHDREKERTGHHGEAGDLGAIADPHLEDARADPEHADHDDD